jgi:hypothetical protein
VLNPILYVAFDDELIPGDPGGKEGLSPFRCCLEESLHAFF